jgi:carbonic anhydrase
MTGESTNVDANEALNRLLSGDKRFVAGKSNEPTGPALIERRHALAKEQKPFAVVVGCSDSRQSGDPIENAVRANARDIAKHLQSASPIIAPLVKSGEVKIVAAYYNLDTGHVELLK